MQDPYAPPKHDDGTAPVIAGPSEDGFVTATATTTEADVEAGLRLVYKRMQWLLPLGIGFAAFFLTANVDLKDSWLAAPIGAAVGYYFWRSSFKGGARRSLAGKTDRERTVTWRFGPETIEISNSASYTRFEWSTFHRSLEGPDTFVLYTSEAVLQVIPKRAFRTEDIETVRRMFASHITPRKKPSHAMRTLLLWVTLILLFLAVWQFMNSGAPNP